MKIAVKVCFLIFLLLPSNLGGITITTFSPTFTPSDDIGPSFGDVDNSFADALQESDVTYLTLELYVMVYDDGISSVIGRYKEQNEMDWINCTLDLSHVFETGWRSYVGNGTEFVLTTEYRTRIWDVKYYACDSMGNWNVTDVVKYSYNLLLSQENPFESIAFYGALAIIVIISIIGIVFWRKH